ncbi:MAG: F0F1 ATP synthase subunit A, partial [Pseudomonadota bacterium]
FIFDNILVSYSDNCAEEPAGTVDISDEIDFDCDDLGAVIPIAAITAIYGLELLVAVIQAYVFTILTCVYLKDALHPHH